MARRGRHGRQRRVQPEARRTPDLSLAGHEIYCESHTIRSLLTRSADPAVRHLAAAVDDLTNLRSLPVEEHAARYREVHNVLQDALSDTDRGGPQPKVGRRRGARC